MKPFKEPLSSMEEKALLSRLKEGDTSAKNELIESNMRLVAHIVKKYNTGGQNFEDIISIGTIGLIKAVNTFNISKGSKLATYASKCIENEILMYLRSEKKRQREVSLYEPIGTDKEGNAINLFDVIESESPDLNTQYDLKSDIQWLSSNIKSILSPYELNVISKRYGLFGEKELTQRELAETLGISRSYVSRIEKRCLQKLKASYYNNKI